MASYFLIKSGWTLTAFVIFTLGVYFWNKMKKHHRVKAPDDFNVCIIGAGISGICMGKRLNDAGLRYVILEKASQLGGTWWENTYPGVACDIPSHLYSFSFFQNPNWSREYSKGHEIRVYLEKVASTFGVYPKIQFNQKVVSSTWNEKISKWILETQDGTKITANVLIGATGTLHIPNTPNFPGKEDFTGQSFHTAEWPQHFNPDGKTIAVIGTGASAVQAVPSLADQGVKSLLVFQRTPCWSPPRHEFMYPKLVRRIFGLFPLINTLYRWAYFWRNELMFVVLLCKGNFITQFLSDAAHKFFRNLYSSSINDPELARKLTPTYSLGCKRITPSDEYIKTFNKPFVHLVTDPIEQITKEGIKTKEKEYNVDTIVYATGFDVLKSSKPLEYSGWKGKSLAEDYDDTPMAYLGISHPLMPNFFSLVGPGTGLGHSSMIYMIECQVNYTLDGITKMVETGVQSMSLRREVLLNYWDWFQDSMDQLVFGDSSQVKGWYRNHKGVNWILYPAGLVRFWWSTRKCQLSEYKLKY